MTAVNLTVPLSTYLRLANDPAQLEGFGPIAAGLARQIIRDAAEAHPLGLAAMTWRCVVVDDQHGTVLGVGSPIKVPKHDPPSRLANRVRTSEPTCCFPGCRIRARDCDLDHRIPYDPNDPGGDGGGGATCSCNLQPLCRTHHRLKTAGLISVRVFGEGEQAGVAAGVMEFTTSTGLRYLRMPTRVTPPSPDLDDPLIATAVAHAGLLAARDADDEEGMTSGCVPAPSTPSAPTAATRCRPSEEPREEYDAEDGAWRQSVAEASRREFMARMATAAGGGAFADELPPF